MVGGVAQELAKGADIGCWLEAVVFFRHSRGGAGQITFHRIIGPGSALSGLFGSGSN